MNIIRHVATTYHLAFCYRRHTTFNMMLLFVIYVIVYQQAFFQREHEFTLSSYYLRHRIWLQHDVIVCHVNLPASISPDRA